MSFRNSFRIILLLILFSLNFTQVFGGEMINPYNRYFIVKLNGDTIYAKDINSIWIDRKDTYLQKDLFRFGSIYINNQKIRNNNILCASIPAGMDTVSTDFYFTCGDRQKYFLKAKYRGRINVYELKDEFTELTFAGHDRYVDVNRLILKVFVNKDGEKETYDYNYKNLLNMFKDNEVVNEEINRMEIMKIELVQRNKQSDGSFNPYINYSIIELINK